MSDVNYSLALPFDTDDPAFARGVEIGRLWEQFKQPEAFEQTIHAENAEMVMRIIESTGRGAHTEEIDGYPEYLILIVEEASDAE